MTKTGTMVFKMEMQNKLCYQLYDDDDDDGDAACTHKVALLLGDQPRPNSTPTPLKHFSVTSIVPLVHLPYSYDPQQTQQIFNIYFHVTMLFMKVWNMNFP